MLCQGGLTILQASVSSLGAIYLISTKVLIPTSNVCIFFNIYYVHISLSVYILEIGISNA